MAPLMLVPTLRRSAFGYSPWDRFLAARDHLDTLLRAEIETRRAAGGSEKTDILGTLLAARYDDGSAGGRRVARPTAHPGGRRARDDRDRFEFAPYGGGHRRCPGAALADYELRIALATILSGSELTLTPIYARGPNPLAVPHNIATGPRAGITFKVLSRPGQNRDLPHKGV